MQVLKEILVMSLNKNRNTSRFSLLIQLYIKLNDVMTLIALSGEEMFYEMGITVDILASLKRATTSDSLEPLHKFWALDGFVFTALKDGISEQVAQWLDSMETLLTRNTFGLREELAFAMKRILFSAENHDILEVERLEQEARPKLPDEEYERIFDYNHAIALWKLNKLKDAEALLWKVIRGYYTLFGISPKDVMGKDTEALLKIINYADNNHENFKRLADSLELLAIIYSRRGKLDPLLRIHAMKFYNLAMAPESMVRVGQDLADDFVEIKDFKGAKEIMKQHVLPVVNQVGLIHRMVQVRSQYAVILALAGQHQQARAEIQRLIPYVDGLTDEQCFEVARQANYIEHLDQQANQYE